MSDFNWLNKVCWFTELNEEASFSSLPVSFGFDRVQKKPEDGHLYAITKQVHGTKIVDASMLKSPMDILPEADGIFTSQRKKIAIATADCIPVLFTDIDGTFVMALHAGWRGLTAGILQKGLAIFREKNIPIENVRALVGPCISPGMYEVGEDVFNAFQSKTMGLSHDEFLLCFGKGRKDRWHVDLALGAVFLLVHEGLSPHSISVYRSCTYLHPLLWPSFRREGQSAGRLYSWISR